MAGEALHVDVLVAGEPGGRPRVEARFDVPPGVTALCGPSGSGKSTCLAAIAGLLRPTRGRVALGDLALFDTSRAIDVPAHRRGVGLVFQALALFPHMSAADNVAYGISRGASRDTRRERARTWLERMRVAHVADRRPATLSGGEAQRVALARALAAEPRVLLLDEPFSALDDALREQLRGELLSLVHQLALPTILVTHDSRDARAMARRVIMLHEGRMQATDTSAPPGAP